MKTPLNVGEWSKTPYARSQAKYSDAAMIAMLERYKIVMHQVTHHLGPSGRPAVTLRFVFRGKPYRISGETMAAKNVTPELLMTQAKRWIYWYLKVLLELVDFFGPAEQLMLGFLESGDSTTVYQAIEPHIASMPSSGQLLGFARKALPPPPLEGEEV